MTHTSFATSHRSQVWRHRFGTKRIYIFFFFPAVHTASAKYLKPLPEQTNRSYALSCKQIPNLCNCSTCSTSRTVEWIRPRFRWFLLLDYMQLISTTIHGWLIPLVMRTKHCYDHRWSVKSGKRNSTGKGIPKKSRPRCRISFLCLSVPTRSVGSCVHRQKTD